MLGMSSGAFYIAACALLRHLQWYHECTVTSVSNQAHIHTCMTWLHESSIADKLMQYSYGSGASWVAVQKLWTVYVPICTALRRVCTCSNGSFGLNRRRRSQPMTSINAHDECAPAAQGMVMIEAGFVKLLHFFVFLQRLYGVSDTGGGTVRARTASLHAHSTTNMFERANDTTEHAQQWANTH